MSYNICMIKLRIQKMKEENIPSIMEIESVSFGKYHWSENSFKSEISNRLAHYYVGLNDNGQVICYCGFWDILGEGHITTFAVREGCKRQKLAEQMMLYIFDEAKKLDVKWFTLEVRMSNIPAINLYQKYGFETIGTREKYYQDNNEDALIMWTPNIYSDKLKLLIEYNKSKIEA